MPLIIFCVKRLERIEENCNVYIDCRLRRAHGLAAEPLPLTMKHPWSLQCQCALTVECVTSHLRTLTKDLGGARTKLKFYSFN